MSETAYLAVLLDGPLQSWGCASRFQRRTTGLHPTKSGVVGLISAAMGLEKGSPEEAEWLPKLAGLRMTSIALAHRKVLRLEDFHTTGGGYDKKKQAQFIPRKASGGPCDQPTLSRRQFLLDARFGVILEGDKGLLERATAALQDPVWGMWFGRKSCIPASPVCRGLFGSMEEAQRCLTGDAPIEGFGRVLEVEEFGEATDSLSDQPASFGDGRSSGPEVRRFAIRRVRAEPGTGLPPG